MKPDENRRRGMRPDERCAITASAQAGLLNDEQALACGLSRDGIKRRVHAGRWHRVLPRVYRINGAPSSWLGDVWAACLWGGATCTASHGSAARLWGLTGFGRSTVEISTVLKRKSNGLPFVVHRVSRPLLSDAGRVDGLPVTSVRRTLLDLAGTRHPKIERGLDEALLKELTSLGQLWLLYEEEWTRGRRGIAILRSLLAERTAGTAPTHSDLELLFKILIRDFALPEPRTQFPIELSFGLVHVDACYPSARLAIELDGYAFHGDRAAFERDRERDNDLQMHGWRVLRFTWAQLRFRAQYVAEMISHHLLMCPRPSGYSVADSAIQ